MTHEALPTTTNIVGLLDESEEPTPWLIEDWLVEGELAMPHGPAHCGKTYAVLDIGLHLAFGLSDWHGFPLVGRRPVLYVPSEGRRGVSRRIGSWLKVHRPDILEATEEDFLPKPVDYVNEYGEPDVRWESPIEIPFERYEGPPDNAVPYLLLDKSPEADKSIAYLQATLKEMADAYGAPPLLVVDVVGDFTSGTDENSRDFGHAVKRIHPEALLGDDPMTTLAVHHEGWTAKGRPRGHSSVDGLVDARFGFDAMTNGDESRAATMTHVKVSNPKQRNEDRRPPIILKLQKPIPDLTSPVVTGRLEPFAIEAGMLSGWKKSGGGGTKTPDSVRRQSERLSPAEVAFMEASRTLAERPDHGGVILMKEYREASGDAKGTANDRRDAMVRKGFAALNPDRGPGGFVLTPLAWGHIHGDDDE